MLINEVCKSCRLTKKAVEYYAEQQLIHPGTLANGYRDFSAGDVERLNKIAVLRKLGLSVPEIQTVLNGSKKSLCHMAAKKAAELEAREVQQELLQMLVQQDDWEYVSSQLDILEQRQSVLERLLAVFPGYYGRYACLHFAAYLNEPIATAQQQEAFDTVIAFLDSVDCSVPADLQEFYEEMGEGLNQNFAAELSGKIEEAFQNTEKYIEDNRESLELFMALKQTEEYKQSPAFRLQEFFVKFNQESGYNDVFIPAMKILSKSYRDYHAAMERANQVFAEKYPNGIN